MRCGYNCFSLWVSCLPLLIATRTSTRKPPLEDSYLDLSHFIRRMLQHFSLISWQITMACKPEGAGGEQGWGRNGCVWNWVVPFKGSSVLREWNPADSLHLVFVVRTYLTSGILICPENFDRGKSAAITLCRSPTLLWIPEFVTIRWFFMVLPIFKTGNSTVSHLKCSCGTEMSSHGPFIGQIREFPRTPFSLM